MPSDHDWHRELLRQMTVDLEGLRPAVLTVETVVALDEYRRFRQVVRNVYAYNLDLGRIEQLGLALGPLFARVRSELLAFAAALDGLARAE